MLLALALTLLSAAPASSPLTGEVQTSHFTLRYTPRAETSARQLSERIETTREQVTHLLDREWPGTTEIRIGVGREEYESLAFDGPPPPPWATALAWPQRNVVLLDAMSLIQPEGENTLRHELVHVALGRIADRWPHWFQEGLAQQVTREREFNTQFAATMAKAVQTKRVFAFSELTDGFPLEASDVEIAYAQSVAFVRFLAERHGRQSFAVLFDAMHEGLPFEGAFARAFKTTLRLEEAAFREELPRRYSWWVLLVDGGWMWALNGPLLVFAYWKHRRTVKALRAAQAQQEALEDALMTLLMHARAANENATVSAVEMVVASATDSQAASPPSPTDAVVDPDVKATRDREPV